ncbi:MAG: YIP1 family protein [Yoonia sp.]|nr:YIP1 family protein [Yoonia sp.]
MAVTTDIMRTWREPRAVMRDLLDQGQREDRALAYLMAACIVIFIAQWPRLSRLAAGFEGTGSQAPELSQLVAYEFLGWLIVWPLMFYAIAAVAHIVAKVFGGQGDWYSARLALFWALLATTPMALLYGLMAGFLGPVAGSDLVGGLWLLSFVVIWISCQREAGRA